jgi:hypothetical protein
MKHFSVFLMALLALSGCAPAPQALNYPPIRFNNSSPITLDVAIIDVVDEYQSPLAPPNVEHLFPVIPLDALHQWVEDRVRASGKDKRLQVIIKDASVVEEKLPLTKGVKGVFTNDQAARYTGRIALEMRIYGDRAVSLASTQINATRSHTLAEGASVAQRDQLFYNLTKQMMADVNAELEKNIQQYFSNYYRYNY